MLYGSCVAEAAKLINFQLFASVLLPLASCLLGSFFGAVQLNLAQKLAASICATPLTAFSRSGRRAVSSRALVLFVLHTTVSDPKPRSSTHDDLIDASTARKVRQ